MPLPEDELIALAKRIAKQSDKAMFFSYMMNTKEAMVDGTTEVQAGVDGLFNLGSDNGKCSFMGGLSAPCAYHMQAGKTYEICISDDKDKVDATKPDFTFKSVARKIKVEGRQWLGCWTDGVSFTERMGLMHEGRMYFVGVSAK